MLALHLLIADSKCSSMIMTRAAIHNTTFFERAIDARLSKVVYSWTDRENLWILERVLELSRAVIEEPFFAIECVLELFTLVCPPSSVTGWSLNRGSKYKLDIGS